MRALVTGANGFVGSHLLRHLLAAGDDVLGAFLPLPGRGFERIDGCQYVKCDVTDYEAVGRMVAEFRPDAIYHLAGIAFVPEAENNFSRALLVNVGGVHVVRACHVLQLGDDLPSSSAEVRAVG